MADQLNNIRSDGAVYLEIGEASNIDSDVAAIDYKFQGDINIAVLGYLDRQISHLHAAYGIRSGHIYRWINIYLVVQGVILTTLYCSAQQLKPQPTWCSEGRSTTPLNLSAIASAGVIYAILCKSIQQFHLLKRRQEFQQERRNFLVENNGFTSKIRNRFLFFNYNRGSVVFDEAEDENCRINWWVAQRAAFLGFLIAFSLCLFFSSSRLLCSQPRHN